MLLLRSPLVSVGKIGAHSPKFYPIRMSKDGWRDIMSMVFSELQQLRRGVSTLKVDAVILIAMLSISGIAIFKMDQPFVVIAIGYFSLLFVPTLLCGWIKVGEKSDGHIERYRYHFKRKIRANFRVLNISIVIILFAYGLIWML